MESNNDIAQTDIAAGVRSGLIMLVVALKNQALYPADNPIRQTAFLNLRNWLTAFLERESKLRLTVRKDRLLYQGEVVHQDKPGDQPLIFPLYRDGVKWFEFHEGIAVEELEAFISLLNRFRVLKDEAEDDLVTAMWETDFAHLKYKTADEFWARDGESEIGAGVALNPLSTEYDPANAGPAGGAKPLASLFKYVDGADLLPPGDEAANAGAESVFQLGLSKVKIRAGGPEAREGPGASEGEGPAEGGDESAPPVDDESNWKLSEGEEARLKAMVAVEELRRETEDCLEIVFIVLRRLNGPQDSAPILEFLIEAVRHALAQGDFGGACCSVEKLRALTRLGNPWVNVVVNEFQKKIATVEVLSAMAISRAAVENRGEDFLADFHRFLFLLIPESLHALAPLFANAGNRRIEMIMIKAIAFQACRINTNVGQVLGRMPAPVIIELLRIMQAQGLVFPPGFLEGLTRHESGSVREAAARTLMAKEPDGLKKIAHLLEDANPGLQRLVCAHLAGCGNPAAENILLDYLNSVYTQKKSSGEDRTLTCYRALGQCASPGAIPFLQGILMKKGWKSFFGDEWHCHRLGAAMALMLMPRESGAREVLERASRSSFRAIRQACQEAAEALTGAADVR
ncbi:MAG: HEAT repeat domain-containing protein [Candidatus Adiutrix sp.]|jgi:hypothetical protein|nr:HEAT repeat domain-containing protein [Candidatus Adiutrix sp.]